MAGGVPGRSPGVLPRSNSGEIVELAGTAGFSGRSANRRRARRGLETCILSCSLVLFGNVCALDRRWRSVRGPDCTWVVLLTLHLGRRVRLLDMDNSLALVMIRRRRLLVVLKLRPRRRVRLLSWLMWMMGRALIRRRRMLIVLSVGIGRVAAAVAVHRRSARGDGVVHLCLGRRRWRGQ